MSGKPLPGVIRAPPHTPDVPPNNRLVNGKPLLRVIHVPPHKTDVSLNKHPVNGIPQPVMTQAPAHKPQVPLSKRPVRRSIQDYVTNKTAKPSALQLEIKEDCHKKSEIQVDPMLHLLRNHPTNKRLYQDEPLELLDASNYSMVKTPEGKNISVGEGGKAEILLARDETTKQLVAVKVSNDKLEDLFEEFGFQTKAHKIIGKFAPGFKGLLQVRPGSPHAVSYGFRYFPVMEFCSITKDSPVALSLLKALTLHGKGHKFFSKYEWFKICRQIMLSVNRLTNGGLHHCDLKIDNILLRFEGDNVYPVIIDYGLAKEGIVYHKLRTLLSPVSDNVRLLRYPHVPPEMFTQNYLLPTSGLYSVAHCISCINAFVFMSKTLNKDMKAYREKSPEERPGYAHFRAIVEGYHRVFKNL